jgi:hypothetical protein
MNSSGVKTFAVFFALLLSAHAGQHQQQQHKPGVTSLKKNRLLQQQQHQQQNATIIKAQRKATIIKAQQNATTIKAKQITGYNYKVKEHADGYIYAIVSDVKGQEDPTIIPCIFIKTDHRNHDAPVVECQDENDDNHYLFLPAFILKGSKEGSIILYTDAYGEVQDVLIHDDSDGSTEEPPQELQVAEGFYHDTEKHLNLETFFFGCIIGLNLMVAIFLLVACVKRCCSRTARKREEVDTHDDGNSKDDDYKAAHPDSSMGDRVGKLEEIDFDTSEDEGSQTENSFSDSEILDFVVALEDSLALSYSRSTGFPDCL